jgi:hypothetical protein
MFFDKKEEVIQIELTQYGKYLLSIGQWKPTYYAFFDDNIIYDGAAAGITEVQNQIEPRIQEGTPQLKPQYSFFGRETSFLKEYTNQEATINSEYHRVKLEAPVQREYSLQGTLGTADNFTQYAPRWKVNFLDGETTSVDHFLTGSLQALRIPQLNCNITYKASIHNIDSTSLNSLQGSYPERVFVDVSSEVYSDGSYVSLETDPFILLVEEENAVFEKENFDIEVFKSGSNGYEPLVFKKRTPQIIDNLLVFQDETQVEIDSTYVEYYFDILVDSEISKIDLCKAITQLKSEHRYVDFSVECPPDGHVYSLNPYVDAAPDPTVCEVDEPENCDDFQTEDKR